MPATPPGHDADAIRRAFAALLDALGLDSGREPELAETPARVAGMYAELLSGLDPAQAPAPVTFPHEGGGDLVIVRDLAFHSLCVHHFVPFFGRALIAYLPGDRIMGISAAARLLDHHARRPQLQERLGREIADAIEALLHPRGVTVILEARHLCMEMRGIRRRGTVETRTVRGELADPRWTEALRLGPDAGA